MLERPNPTYSVALASLAATLLLATAACPSGGRAADVAVASRAPSSRSWMWGVTIDDVTPLGATVESLGGLRARPTARVVFDEGRAASDYVAPVTAIHGVADVMGEVLDSQFVARVGVHEYEERTREYVAALGDEVDVWEIGNEVNGEWLGSRADVAAKLSAAYGVVSRAGRPTAITLHHGPGCADAEHQMFPWVDDTLPDEVRAGVDYVFVSYYEDDCPSPTPDWRAIFSRLAKTFPRAALGIGECGTSDEERKERMLARYYALRVEEPRFVGGFFWWYFSHDMVPRTRPLWSALDRAIVPAADTDR